jgi:hypothetical protein
MASREHSYTRRAILGAAVAVPVASFDRLRMSGKGAAGVGSARPSPRPRPQTGEGVGAPRAWITALAAFCWAEADLKAFDRQSCAASAGPIGRSFEAQEALDDEFAGFVDAADGAMLRLLGTPAPDLDALVLKIALIGDHLVWEMTGGEDCLAWLEADARRLARAGTGRQSGS